MQINQQHQLDRLVRLKEVMGVTGLSKSTIYDLISKNRFPQQFNISERAVGWRESSIRSWLDSKEQKNRIESVNA